MGVLKVLFVGDGWLGSNARSLADGMSIAGHDVVLVDTTSVSRPKKWSGSWGYSKVRGSRRPADVDRIHRSIESISASWRPDILFGFKTNHLDQERLLSVPAAARIHYSADDVSNPDNVTSAYLAHERQWDLIVTTKTHNVPELLERGARDAQFVMSAYDPAWHHRSARRGSQTYDLGFVGNMRPDRLAAMERLALRHRDRMLIAGPGWSRSRALRTSGAHIGAGFYGEAFSHSVASVRANLVFLNSENRDTHTCRSLEVPAAGGLFVGQRTDEHRELLVEGTEALFFDSEEELDDILARLANGGPDAVRIAENGYRAITEGRHAYADRAVEILSRWT